MAPFSRYTRRKRHPGSAMRSGDTPGGLTAGAVAAQVLLEEVDGPTPRGLGVLLVVGAQSVGVVEERVTGALVEVELDVVIGRRVDLLLEPLGVVDRDEVVGGAEVADHRRVQVREVRLAVRHDVVEGRDGVHLRVDRRRPYRK